MVCDDLGTRFSEKKSRKKNFYFLHFLLKEKSFENKKNFLKLSFERKKCKKKK
jgi:hypothetical protein